MDGPDELLTHGADSSGKVKHDEGNGPACGRFSSIVQHRLWNVLDKTTGNFSEAKDDDDVPE